MDEKSVVAFLNAALPNEEWERAEEFGDGNLNFIFRISNKANTRSIICKHAVPYVRCIGESWPLEVHRNYFDGKYLELAGQLCPGRVPKVFHMDEKLAAFVMEDLRSHVTVRKALQQQIICPNLSQDVGEYLATMAFKTSIYGCKTEERRSLESFFARNSVPEISYQVIFTDPYDPKASTNNWSKPELDSDALEHFNDELKLKAAVDLFENFQICKQAIIHGDFHTGSIMVTTEDTKVIDGEFAMFGPIGYDVGNYMAHLIMGYITNCHSMGTKCNKINKWILEQIETIWQVFVCKFCQLFDDSSQTQNRYCSFLKNHKDISNHIKADFLKKVWSDSCGYCGMEMTRRMIGVVTIEEYQLIADREKKICAERHTLQVARSLMISRTEISMEQLLQLVQEI